MLGTIKRPAVLIAIVFVAAATVIAIIDDKVANLLIGAAMVASVTAVFEVMMDRRLGDAYDSGKLSAGKRTVRD